MSSRQNQSQFFREVIYKSDVYLSQASITHTHINTHKLRVSFVLLLHKLYCIYCFFYCICCYATVIDTPCFVDLSSVHPFFLTE